MGQKHCILNTFKCHKIFLNIDQILDVNQKFLSDLQQGNRPFGLLCKEHVKYKGVFLTLANQVRLKFNIRLPILNATENICWNNPKLKNYTPRNLK